MNEKILQDLKSRKTSIAVVGLGYVGLPLAFSFSKKFAVVGYDCNLEKVKILKKGIDPTGEIPEGALKTTTIDFVFSPSDLKKSKFLVVAVPTPVDTNKRPDLSPLIKSSEIVGKNLTRGSIVVYESTVYPGVTEDICIPILERESGLKAGKHFSVGYSPERINPGDKDHRLENIVKVVSALDKTSLEIVAEVYGTIITAGVHRASSIKVAEAAKVIENTQRDLNIALMNELSIIFHKLGIDTQEVLAAAGTKWNFLKFVPGLVGGHCIGVDPYYLTYKAEELGYHPEVILAGRRINDGMGKFIAESTVKEMARVGKTIRGARILIMGLTFKENVGDLRNSRVVDIISELKEYGIEPIVHDPLADSHEAMNEYGVKLCKKLSALPSLDAVVLAVPHNSYRKLDLKQMVSWCGRGEETPLLIDIKGFFDPGAAKIAGFRYWRL